MNNYINKLTHVGFRHFTCYALDIFTCSGCVFNFTWFFFIYNFQVWFFSTIHFIFTYNCLHMIHIFSREIHFISRYFFTIHLFLRTIVSHDLLIFTWFFFKNLIDFIFTSDRFTWFVFPIWFFNMIHLFSLVILKKDSFIFHI